MIDGDPKSFLRKLSGAEKITVREVGSYAATHDGLSAFYTTPGPFIRRDLENLKKFELVTVTELPDKSVYVRLTPLGEDVYKTLMG